MPALTLKRPWADLILRHGKNVENRSWATHYRGPVLLHAGRGFDKAARPFATSIGVRAGATYWTAAAHAEGIVAVAELIGICSGHPCRCGAWAAFGQQHWQLGRVQPLHHPVPARGRLGLWWPESALVAAALERVSSILAQLCQVAVPQVALPCPVRGDGHTRNCRCEVIGEHTEHRIGEHTVRHAIAGSRYNCTVIDQARPELVPAERAPTRARP